MENYNKDTKEMVIGWEILREKALKSLQWQSPFFFEFGIQASAR